VGGQTAHAASQSLIPNLGAGRRRWQAGVT